ncbi:MAG: ABC transporter permease [Bacteroidetes bacterium]|jgi:ABC-2 type transport system permease protein|nr:ABC transporter permease [Bacteroidota bacterium]MBT3750912.1 ABC transporter permease [Bacteroidota bacterium]MBT4408599.1 ABC transporter permease [Bacteroidota bacterium]MBT5426483.1 ABC transporter permease [Bacteroidota bacterium]MBT7092085.1 ABC transporter permease [Bacteroidota bacterium]
MRSFTSFVIKEFHHIFRDRKTLIVLFGIPVVQILIFGYVITNNFKDIGIAVMDQSNDIHSKGIQSKVFSSGYFIYKGAIRSEKEIESKFQRGDIRAVLVFPSKFTSDIEGSGSSEIQIITDASDPNLANTVVNYLSGIVRQYQVQKLGNGLQKSMMVVETRMLFNESLKGAYMFVPGTMALILLLICALLTSISVAREKELGTMEVLLVSPLRPAQIILGKVMPYVGLGFINAIVILLMGTLVFQLPISGSLILLMAELLLYIVLSLSLGIFISTMAPNQQVAMFISLFALMLPAVLLSGFIYPIENMPLVLQWLSYIIPPRWFIIIVKDIMLKGNGLEYIWDETLILTGMTVIFIIASIRKFKIRLEG